MLPFYPVLLWKLRWSTYDTETKIVHINFERFNNQGYIPVFIICNISANGIGCFVCTSLNRGNQGCEDTFNNTGEFYRSDCQASRDGRIGMFPATQCIKMVAEDSKHINTRGVLAKTKSKINQYSSFGSYLETFVLVHVCMFFCPIHNKSLIGCETCSSLFVETANLWWKKNNNKEHIIFTVCQKKICEQYETVVITFKTGKRWHEKALSKHSEHRSFIHLEHRSI